jgi:hypothetical protein
MKLHANARTCPHKPVAWRSIGLSARVGRLKHNYGLAFLRVRGIERVRLHADLTMLARLALAVSRARTM